MYSHFFSNNISIYAIFNDQSFKDTLTDDIVSSEQLGPESKIYHIYPKYSHRCALQTVIFFFFYNFFNYESQDSLARSFMNPLENL